MIIVPCPFNYIKKNKEQLLSINLPERFDDFEEVFMLSLPQEILLKLKCPHCGALCKFHAWAFKCVYDETTGEDVLYMIPRVKCTNDKCICKKKRKNTSNVTHCVFPKELLPYFRFKGDLANVLIKLQEKALSLESKDSKDKEPPKPLLSANELIIDKELENKYDKSILNYMIKDFLPKVNLMYNCYKNLRNNIEYIASMHATKRQRKTQLPANEAIYYREYIEKSYTQDNLFTTLISIFVNSKNKIINYFPQVLKNPFNMFVKCVQT